MAFLDQNIPNLQDYQVVANIQGEIKTLNVRYPNAAECLRDVTRIYAPFGLKDLEVKDKSGFRPKDEKLTIAHLTCR